MSIYDEIRCYYPLPDPEAQDWTFQTTDLECRLLVGYTINESGRLIHHNAHLEPVPPEKRPYYGTQYWDESPLARLCGSMKIIPDGDEDTNFHGDLNFYTVRGRMPNGKLWEISGFDGKEHYVTNSLGEKIIVQFVSYDYVARFNNGQLEWIHRRIDDG